MELDGVEVTCAWCGRKWLICRSCWRGQRYCCDECQAAAREVQVDQAKRTYASSAKGRVNQQKRQRHYRLKLAEAQRTKESLIVGSPRTRDDASGPRSLPAGAVVHPTAEAGLFPAAAAIGARPGPSSPSGPGDAPACQSASETSEESQESVTDQATRGVVTECILDAEPHDDATSKRARRSKNRSRAGPPARQPHRPTAGHEEALRFKPAPAGAVCAECRMRIRRILVGPLPLFLSLRGFG